jgi:hypothetical protein
MKKTHTLEAAQVIDRYIGNKLAQASALEILMERDLSVAKETYHTRKIELNKLNREIENLRITLGTEMQAKLDEQKQTNLLYHIKSMEELKSEWLGSGCGILPDERDLKQQSGE